MKSSTYDRLKWVSLVFLPALASLYFALGEVWHFPMVPQVVGTITIVDTFLGLLIGKTSKDFREKISDTEFMGHLTIVQDYDGMPLQIRMDPKDKNPIFTDGKTAQFLIRREPLE